MASKPVSNTAQSADQTVGSFAIKVGNSPAPSICRGADAPLKKTPAFGGRGKPLEEDEPGINAPR